jgi:cytochrome c-type biogenesis protein CcmH
VRRMCPGLLALLLAIAPSAADTDLETAAKHIEGRLMSPCCMTNTVAVHESGASYKMRREIREMLAAGQTERQILDHYVQIHGTQILAMPEAKGFSLTPYVFPLLFLLSAGGALAISIRRWRTSARGVASPAVPPQPAGPWADRLRNELDRLD